MTPLALVLVLVFSIVALALLGPRLLQNAAPALVRVPRLAIGMISAAILVWLAALLALGPMLAWISTGPALLSEGATAVCQRCLMKANPFAASDAQLAIPAMLLLAVPAVLALSLTAGLLTHLMRRGRRSRDAARHVTRNARSREVHGHVVQVVDNPAPFALTFPARHGGIVLSTRALEVLDQQELHAVLAHERAHLSQRHHLLSAVVGGFAVLLRWVPLMRAAADALPHYLEIAADNEASRRIGTPALVSALVKLGERPDPTSHSHSSAHALHAAGPERIRQLVQPSGGLAGAAPALTVASCLVVLGIVSVVVHLPYASAALSGC